MRFRVEIARTASGDYAVHCSDFTGCRAEGATREEALANIRRAIAFYEEMCPCDVTSEEGIELDVVEHSPR